MASREPPMDSPVTPASLARAKAERDAERREIEEKAGVRILEDGTAILLDRPVAVEAYALDWAKKGQD